MKRPLVLALAALLGGIVVALLVRGRGVTGDASKEPQPTFAPSARSGATSVTELAPRAAVPSAGQTADVPGASAPSPTLAASGRGMAALGSARQTVATQERLLRERNDDAFRATFTPEVRAELTADVIESCRKRLGRHSVVPDWDVAESSVEPDDAGKPHRVLRVSMWGKSMTGFHEVEPDVWLADAAWCVPIW